MGRCDVIDLEVEGAGLALRDVIKDTHFYPAVMICVCGIIHGRSHAAEKDVHKLIPTVSDICCCCY